MFEKDLDLNFMYKLFLKIRKRTLIWDTITTTILTTIGKGAGFLITFFVATWFGISTDTDAFFFVYGLVIFLSMIFAPVVESVIVPFIIELKSKNEDIGKFVGKILSISGLGLLGLIAIAIFIIKPILTVITKFDSKELDLIYLLFLEICPFIIFMVWSSVLAGVLNAYKEFSFPAISPLYRATINLIVIYFFKDSLGIHSIILGYLIGEIIRCILLFVKINHLKLFKISINFNPNIQINQFLITSFYQAIGMSITGLNPIVDKTMASWLSKGSVSVLEYGDKLFTIPTTFMTAGLLATLLSHWCDTNQQMGINKLKQQVNKAAKYITLISLFITVILILFSKSIVGIVFYSINFSLEKKSEITLVWICYLIGLIPTMLGRVYMRGHLTLKNTKILMQYGVISIFLNIILNYILMERFGTAGIALSTSIASIFYFIYIRTTFLKECKNTN